LDGITSSGLCITMLVTLVLRVALNGTGNTTLHIIRQPKNAAQYTFVNDSVQKFSVCRKEVEGLVRLMPPEVVGREERLVWIIKQLKFIRS
jgi:hypothetical protein